MDWKLESCGVPVWVFNTGLNPKRAKCLTLFLSDRRAGFSQWNLAQITYLNDLKWSKPGHITFKIINKKENGIKENSVNSNIKNKKSKKALPKDQELENECGEGSSGNVSDGLIEFGVLKFDSEFECAKFYDFYRALFTDAAHDDLFNPHFNLNNSLRRKNNSIILSKMTNSMSESSSLTNRKSDSTSSSKTSNIKNNNNQSSLIKCLYKKITKSAISNPVAFNHINSLSMVCEEDRLLNNLNLEENVCQETNSSDERMLMLMNRARDLSMSYSADTRSISSEITVSSSNMNSNIYGTVLK
jgi:hypothetical protein